MMRPPDLRPPPGPDAARKKLSAEAWLPRVPSALALCEIEPVQLRWGRLVYRAQSARGAVAVKVFRGDQIAVPAWTLSLIPLVGFLRPPEIIHAQPEPGAAGGVPLTFLISKWIAGTPIDFSKEDPVGKLAEALAQLHSVRPSDLRCESPGVGRLALEAKNPGWMYRRQVERAVRSIGAALRDVVNFRPEGIVQDLLEAVARLYREDADHPLIHGSIRPDHVLVNRAGDLRFIDFDVARFAPCELEIAGVLARTLSHRDFFNLLERREDPTSSLQPGPFEARYFARRGAEALERWKQRRREALLLAALVNLGRRARVLEQFRSKGPGNSRQIDEQLRNEWEEWMRAAER